MRLLIFLICGLSFPLATTAQAPADQAKKPKHYVIELSDAKRREKTGEIRGYIWRHWIKHEPGSLLVTSYSKEGLRSDVEYRLEMDGNGIWGMRVEISRPDLKGTKYEHGEYWVYGIDRIRPPTPLNTNKIPVPNDAELSVTQYRLLFRDQNGKGIWRGSL